MAHRIRFSVVYGEMLEAKPDRAELAEGHSTLLPPLNCTYVTAYSRLTLLKVEYELMKVALHCRKVLFRARPECTMAIAPRSWRRSLTPNEPITRSMLDEVIDAILDGVGSMFKDVRGHLDGMDTRFDKVEGRLDRLEVGQSYIKDLINGLKADLSDTPSRRQFEKLKARVDKYHPLTSQSARSVPVSG